MNASIPFGAASRSRRNSDRLTRLGHDRTDGRIRRRTDNVQRTRYLPTQLGKFANQLPHRNSGVSGVAGAADAEPQDLVADGELGDVGPHGGHYAGKVAALAGRKRGGKYLVHRANADGGFAGSSRPLTGESTLMPWRTPA
ncbi:hypothetical protein ABH37_10370 [Mycobacterium haemophilum]|uniref:Uncharacterized protein n=1 Tax=Mycobacterium haemophilum TaxID=29311 RepID=A0A0I9VGP4_9MYCO|nr:hypothetical protein ABH39_07825 [Mycobacterium haemophilum]KLO36638.1 hypothetical protein ABH38_11740 [Mycobacterium haemophilum]KLO42566.1 hypothetical protein ABH37_10370 [Mycobacterium haemophilum]KLO55443.1 hypothetical protein ABH36_07350 [Mycobacterium haemophilum]